ncbi:MAG TPA: GNAT family N-acetyltransferase [Gemmataceae bacterium]|jgi:ribosomal protein S18 acetylase RimI-like enzyme|nr:GNAT family N-acetyltransferase [Gemmataceae bacterium]
MEKPDIRNPSPRIAPAKPLDFIPGLRLMFQHLPQEEAYSRSAKALHLLRGKAPETPRLLLAEEVDEIAGVILVQALVGGTGIVWPPHVAAEEVDRIALEDALVQEAIQWLRQNGAKLAQAVLYEDEAPHAGPLERNGFIHPTQLWYLRHELELPPELLCEPETLSFQTYAECDRNLFHRVLWQSYEQTRDFPEVSGRRSIEDVVRGLQAVGYNPQHWWLAWSAQKPAGVLILSVMPDVDGWEISYVGVIPETRKRGFGRELVRKALFETKAMGGHEVVLSVDARNEPALRLYAKLGFEVYEQREVYLGLWG